MTGECVWIVENSREMEEIREKSKRWQKWQKRKERERLTRKRCQSSFPWWWADCLETWETKEENENETDTEDEDTKEWEKEMEKERAPIDREEKAEQLLTLEQRKLSCQMSEWELQERILYASQCFTLPVCHQASFVFYLDNWWWWWSWDHFSTEDRKTSCHTLTYTRKSWNPPFYCISPQQHSFLSGDFHRLYLPPPTSSCRHQPMIRIPFRCLSLSPHQSPVKMGEGEWKVFLSLPLFPWDRRLKTWD